MANCNNFIEKSDFTPKNLAFMLKTEYLYFRCVVGCWHVILSLALQKHLLKNR